MSSKAQFLSLIAETCRQAALLIWD